MSRGWYDIGQADQPTEDYFIQPEIESTFNQQPSLTEMAL